MISLTIRGLALQDPLAVELAPRTLLVGPNESGKSTILNALRAVTSGEASIEGVGNVPGALLALGAPGKILTIDAECDGAGIRSEVNRKGQTKIATLQGFDCRFAHVALKGSAEEIRKFLANNVRAPKEWTRERVGRAVVAVTRKPVDVPPAASILESVNAMLKAAKENSKMLRASLRKAEATELGAREDAAKIDAIGGEPLPVLEAKQVEEAAALVAVRNRINDLDVEARRWNAAQTAAKNARERYDAVRAAPPAVPDLAALEAKLADAAKAEAAAEKELQALATEEAQADAAIDKVGGELADFEHRLKDAQNRLAAAELGTCSQCGQEIAKDRLAALRASVSRLTENVKVMRSRSDAAIEAHKKAAEACVAADAEASAAANAHQRAQDDLGAARHQAEVADGHAKRLEELKAAAAEAAAAVESMTAPPTWTDLDAKAKEIESVIALYEDKIITAKARANARAFAERTAKGTVDAGAALKASESVEEVLRGVRNQIVAESTGPLQAALGQIAIALQGTPIVDIGDEDRDPLIGIQRGDHSIPFAVLSAGARATFLGGLAAALLEQSTVAPDRRILLIEAGEVDMDKLDGLCRTLHGAAVGHIVIATHVASRLVNSARRLANEWGWATPEWRTAVAEVPA